jgi:ornithine carbamoyltransferase
MSDLLQEPVIIDQAIGAARTIIETDRLALRGKSLVSMADVSREQLDGILQIAMAMDVAHKAGVPLFTFRYPKSLAMIFEKPSLRTRVTFDLGFRQLGGNTVLLGQNEIMMGKRESAKDVALNLERWVDVIMARVFEHSKLVELDQYAKIPIINALSDHEHPCQTLADLQTILQYKGRLAGIKLAWTGDGNNVLHSLLIGAALSGLQVTAACPPGFEPSPEVVAQAHALAEDPSTIQIVADPLLAVQNADIVYTDTWTSMGQEDEAERRRAIFAPYQVNSTLLAKAKASALFMHCLPAHRGEEVTDDVLDGPQSVVYDQAENRLHAQKAIMALLVGP